MTFRRHTRRSCQNAGPLYPSPNIIIRRGSADASRLPQAPGRRRDAPLLSRTSFRREREKNKEKSESDGNLFAVDESLARALRNLDAATFTYMPVCALLPRGVVSRPCRVVTGAATASVSPFCLLWCRTTSDGSRSASSSTTTYSSWASPKPLRAHLGEGIVTSAPSEGQAVPLFPASTGGQV